MDPANPGNDILRIKIWILSYTNTFETTKGNFAEKYLLGTDSETTLYNFLWSNYPDINKTFHEFYNNYAQNIVNPLNSNHVAQALSALA